MLSEIFFRLRSLFRRNTVESGHSIFEKIELF